MLVSSASMGDTETVKVVLRKSDLAPGLKNIDLKSLREAVAKAQNKQQAASKLPPKTPGKEPVVLRQFSTPEKIVVKSEPLSPETRQSSVQKVVSIKPGTWTQPLSTPVKRVSFDLDNLSKVSTQGKKIKIVKLDKPNFSCGFCVFTSADADLYRRHISSHVRKAIRCKKCEFSTDSIAAFNRHISTHKNVHTDLMKTYPCSVCDFKGLTPQALIKHKASLRHNKLKTSALFTCKICGFSDADVAKLTQHVSLHDAIDYVTCEKCNNAEGALVHNKRCPEVVNPLRYHYEEVIVRPRKRQLNCTLCDFQSDEILCLMEHIKAHSRKRTGEDEHFDAELPFCCTMCDYRCVRPTKLVEHMKTHGPGAIFCCKECSFESKDISVFKAHWKSHTMKSGCHKCFVCLATFPSSSVLSEHMIVHSKGKPFACNICEYQCLTKQQLLLHLKSHSKKKTQVFFPCPLCKSKYSTSVSLRKHLRTHGPEDKPFRCDHCDYSCYTSELLTVHMKTHSAEFKFRCEICHSAFASEATLKAHVLDHVALVTPALCTACNRTFPSRALLAKHRASVHAGKSFACEICNIAFIDEREYNTHMVEHEIAETEDDADKAMLVEQEDDQASKNLADPQEKFNYVEEGVYGSEAEDDNLQETQNQALEYPMVTE